MPDLNKKNPDRYEITFQAWDQVASAYQDHFMDLDLYHDTYNTFCRLMEKPGVGIFEIGCGPGNITKYLLSKRPDFKIEAIDISPNMIKLAKENNPTADFSIMDCRKIGELTTNYDGIVCGFCLPYLSEADSAKLIKDCSYLLNNDGIIYLSTIEGSYHQSGFETSSNSQNKMFVYYYPEHYVEKELKVNDFDIIDVKRKSFSRIDGTASNHLIFIAKKKKNKHRA